MSQRIYLSGKGPSDAIEWDFYCSEGRKSGKWTKIPVPSNWEQHGFGNYDYGHIPPDEKHDEVGSYKTTFMAPEDWKDKFVRLVFEGSMTETSVKINGSPVGVPHQGGYLPFWYPLNSPHAQNANCLRYGEVNELEVRVSKKPSNESLDYAERKADFWVFGGIYRPVYLEVLPKIFINRLAIDAKANGSIILDVFPQVHQPIKTGRTPESIIDQVEAQVFNREGEPVGDVFSCSIPGAMGKVRLTSDFSGIIPWSTENPQLYILKVRLRNRGAMVFEKSEEFGFRTFEVRAGDALYLNGKEVKIKGVNRNLFHPETARAIDSAMAWKDARLIKDMNANLVRSHLPATQEFMKACDHLGLLVISELTNWQQPFIDAPIARNLIYELVTTYQNHPSVILWANGNEGGFNVEVDEMYHLYDIQNRHVIHPWEVFEGIDALHYPSYGIMQAKAKSNTIYLPTELLHGLYDGGLGAGLDDYWSLVMKTPILAGGVLWCWADAALMRTDKDGVLDTDGNHSADGIVGPYREKEASYFTIKEIWSPVQIEVDKIPYDFNGQLPVKNNFSFTSLDKCSFRWNMKKYVSGSKKFTIAEKEIPGGEIIVPKVKPGSSGELHLILPDDWKNNNALMLSAFDPMGRKLMEWSWPINDDRLQQSRTSSKPELIQPNTVKIGKTKWIFDVKSGHLIDCQYKGKSIGLGNGPVLYTSLENAHVDKTDEWNAKFEEKNGTVYVHSMDETTGSEFSWLFKPDGQVEVSYNFTAPENSLTYCAVGFDLPDEAVSSKQWLGDGPYRIWANRKKGPQFGLWENDYNEGIPGADWDYPVFKGIFGNVDWMKILLKEDISLIIDPEALQNIGILSPGNVEIPDSNPEGNKNVGPRTAVWEYPERGGLFIFYKVPAVGTKFKKANTLGPQSQDRKIEEIKGKLWFNIEAN